MKEKNVSIVEKSTNENDFQNLKVKRINLKRAGFEFLALLFLVKPKL